MAKKVIGTEQITSMGVAANAAFQRGLSKKNEQPHLRVATRVPSSTSKEEYGWLGKWPRIREWVGDRVHQQLKAHSYTIKNKSFESTVDIDRDDVEDDNVGTYAPMFEELGQEVADFPSDLVFALLKNGNSLPCYDKQYFFDTDHPVIDKDGNEQSVSNWGGGAGDLWILMDTSRALKPVIHQVRRDFDTVSLDRPDDPNVFERKTFVYGVDGRMNVGFGFWQLAYASRQPLTPDNFKAAFAALENMTGDGGRPLNVQPDLLVTVPNNRSAAQKLLKNMLAAGGETNEWMGSTDLLITAWLK